jgi:hypothetical protein
MIVLCTFHESVVHLFESIALGFVQENTLLALGTQRVEVVLQIIMY